jgi:hypothetical protein
VKVEDLGDEMPSERAELTVPGFLATGVPVGKKAGLAFAFCIIVILFAMAGTIVLSLLAVAGILGYAPYLIGGAVLLAVGGIIVALRVK